MLDKMQSFFRDNGVYMLFVTVAGYPFHWLRNRMLAAKFNVRTLSIGPRSHLRGLAAISLGEDFSSAEGLWMEAITHHGDQRFSPRLVIGSHVRISRWSHIACTHSVAIGDDVLIGSKVIITDHNHGTFGSKATNPTVPPDQRPLECNRFVIIGAKAWLGDGVVVCPGVTIGEGSVVGANSVVTTDIPAFTLAVGVPARIIKRFDAERGTWIRV